MASTINDLDTNRIDINLYAKNDCSAKNLKSSEYNHSESVVNDALFEKMPIGCMKLTELLNIITINECGTKQLGIQKIHLIGKNVTRYLSPNSLSIFNAYIKDIQSLSNHNIKVFQFISRDGSFIDFNVDVKLISTDPQGELQIFLFFSPSQNIETKSSPYNLDRLDIIYRQNSVNEIAGIIAHELKNPLTVILNYLKGCIHKIETKNYADSDILKALNSAYQQSHRVNELILRLRHFQYRKTLSMETVSVNEMIENVISIIKNDINDTGIEIQFRCINNVNVISDKLYMEQLLLNLCRNAIDSLKDNAILDPLLIVEVNRINKNFIEIKVIDNGPGFNKEIAQRMFDPYFTTKPYGIGIGLALSQSIAMAHGSRIDAETNFFNGATFRFELKLSTQ